MSSVDSLPASLRQLVDTRLDSIDRVLLCTNVDRSERREIVQSVEDQIYVMLDRCNEPPSRESVLAVLAMTDPPEAYLTGDGLPQNRPGRGGIHLSAVKPAQLARRVTPLAVVSCVLGVLSVLSLIFWPLSAVMGLAAIVCGTIALTQIHYSDRLRGVWLSIIGMSAPALAMVALFVLVAL